MKNNLIDIAINFVKVRDITYVQRGQGLLTSSADRDYLRPARTGITYVHSGTGITFPPPAPVEVGDAHAAVLWRGNYRC